ncbi:hypothetical protein ES703_118715 [subsurface metagenome]
MVLKFLLSFQCPEFLRDIFGGCAQLTQSLPLNFQLYIQRLPEFLLFLLNSGFHISFEFFPVTIQIRQPALNLPDLSIFLLKLFSSFSLQFLDNPAFGRKIDIRPQGQVLLAGTEITGDQICAR